MYQLIIGVDFLKHFNLWVNVNNNKLIDARTQFSSIENPVNINSKISNISFLLEDIPFHKILKKYPAHIAATPHQNSPNCETLHHIEMTGFPVFSKPQHLASDMLHIVQ